ncbi:MAG TPA: hypothetical protein VLA97_09365 [Nocardioidaceae bacterium]|nr:hypothetical protein [Nocardioidaceae bacterium]
MDATLRAMGPADDEASLDGNSADLTGALGVYARAGFAGESRWTDYSLTVPAGAGLR